MGFDAGGSQDGDDIGGCLCVGFLACHVGPAGEGVEVVGYGGIV